MREDKEDFDFLDNLLQDETRGSEDSIPTGRRFENEDDGMLDFERGLDFKSEIDSARPAQPEGQSTQPTQSQQPQSTQVDSASSGPVTQVSQGDQEGSASLGRPPAPDGNVSMSSQVEADSFVEVGGDGLASESADDSGSLDIVDDLDGLSPEMLAALEWEPPEPKSTEDLMMNEWIQTGWVGDLHIDQILTEAILTGASDVHIAAGLRVSMTRNGDILRYDGYAIPDEDIMHEVIHNGILTHQQQQIFNTEFEYEGAYTLMFGPMEGRRTRLTLGRTFGRYFMVFRIISEHIPDIDELGIEEEMVNWAKYPNGLFLLCGPTGSGKSTTLASIVYDLQRKTMKKIITIEKPIEYVYPDDTPSLIVQRDVGEDTRGFYEGLTSAMRQSPNVILLGEVRNTEEVTELLRAAETGHLAISTMHTNSVPTTINRIQNLFDGNEQRRIMSTLAETLRGIGNQVLVKTKDGEGRFAVRELLTINDEIKRLIETGDIRGIRDYQIRNKATMEHKLIEAVRQGRCHLEDAMSHTADPVLFDKLVKGDVV